MAEAGRQDKKKKGVIEDTELDDDMLEQALLDYDTPSKPLSQPVIDNTSQPPNDPESILAPGMEAFDPSHMDELNAMMEGVLGKDMMEEYQAFSKELGENLPDMFNLQGLEKDLFPPFDQTETQPTSKPTSKVPTSSKTTDETIQDLHKNLEFANSVLPPDPPSLQKEGEDLLGMVKELMGDLLSREVLYIPLKDLSKQYPPLLELDNEMSGEDRKRYTRQHDIIKEVCSMYESESASDSQETRVKREEKILSRVQELQSLGNPPPGVVEEPQLPNFSQLLEPKNACNTQ